MKLQQSTNGLTANYNNYSAAELEKALQSWVEPYPKPIILNHDLSSEPIGRVIAAKMDKEQDGAPFVRLQIAITDPHAAQKISDQRYLTGSVGGRAGKAVCSISGEDYAAETSDGRPRMPKYKRGQVYKGKLAYIDMQDISFKEYSFVNQPADQRSGVRSSKALSSDGPITDSEGWTAKSSAFILKMDEEDIISVEENESILKGLKKKESRPMYLHLKGAFLTALAFQESETDKANNKPLLSGKNIDNEEIVNMDEVKNVDDVLAAVESLSQDLSAMSTTSTPEADEVEKDAEPAAEAPLASTQEENLEEVFKDFLSKNTAFNAEVSEKINSVKGIEEALVNEFITQRNNDNALWSTELMVSLGLVVGEKQEEEVVVDTEEKQSEATAEQSEEPAEKEAVDSVEPVEPKENGEQEEPNAELTGEIKSEEQEANGEDEKLQTLQKENAKLKEALHRTLAERVVDTKIALGLDSSEERENLIKDHVTRSASSLADSLRDLAKMPLPKKNIQKLNDSLIENDILLEVEDNVIVEDDVSVASPAPRVKTAEELFIDTLMGRRKL